MTVHTDVYAPPGANLVRSDDESARQRLLSHEASVRSVGGLYLLGASFMLVLGIALVSNGSEAAVPGSIYALLGLVQGAIGVRVLKLDRRMRIPVGVVSGLGLLAFPLGTLINAYVLWLFFSDKGRQVLSPEHQALIERTAHMRYRTPKAVIALALLLLGLIGLGIWAAVA